MSKFICTHGPNKGDEFPIMQGTTVVGRNHKDCQINLFDKRTSHLHFKIVKDGKNYYVEDFDSRNGTILNGKDIGHRNRVTIAAGDVITIGGTKLLLSEKGGGDITERTATDVAADLQEKSYTKLLGSAAATVQKQSFDKAAAQEAKPSLLGKLKNLFRGGG